MAKYFELTPDIFAKYVPKLSSEIDENITFNHGVSITSTLKTPLVFVSGHSSKEPPKGMHGLVYPIMSDEFIMALQQGGISNLQCFPAEIRSRTDNSIWKNYKVVNIKGSIAAADIDKSQYTHIMDGADENTISLMAFENLKIDDSRAAGSLLFILAEEPGTIIIAESIVEFLRKQKSDKEWGITIDER